MNVQSTSGRTALMFAARTGLNQCVKSLIEKGTDVNTTDYTGSTAVRFAANEGHCECVNVLINSAADVNVIANDGSTVLMRAAFSGDVTCVKSVLKAGAHVNRIDNENRNALDHCCHRNDDTNELIMTLYASGEEVSDFAADFVKEKTLKATLNLKDSCRISIRKRLIEVESNIHLFTREPQLGLPSSLIKYLLYDISL